VKGGGRENRENVKERRKRKDERKTEPKIVFKKCKRPKLKAKKVHGD
jgi:ribose 1,5-bisphosphokinase PhnN